MKRKIDIAAIRERNLRNPVADPTQRIASREAGLGARTLDVATVHHALAEGYAPLGYGLADFTIVRHGEWFHLFHIPRVPGALPVYRCHEHWLGHARSKDLDTWITLGPALCVEPCHPFECGHIWAPFVMRHDSQHLMYYTGLSDQPSQTLCLATSDDPDLACWTRHPDNPLTPQAGFDWHWKPDGTYVRHARDPHVVRIDRDTFLMAYTTAHANGCPAVGGLVSTDLRQWHDIGPMLFRPMAGRDWMPESINIQPLDDRRWVLIASQSPGLERYVSDDPFHWHDAEAEPITYAEGDERRPLAPELLACDDDAGTWLIAYFEQVDNRLFIGELHLDHSPWTLHRLRNPADLERWWDRLA